MIPCFAVLVLLQPVLRVGAAVLKLTTLNLVKGHGLKKKHTRLKQSDTAEKSLEAKIMILDTIGCHLQGILLAQ